MEKYLELRRYARSTSVSFSTLFLRHAAAVLDAAETATALQRVGIVLGTVARMLCHPDSRPCDGRETQVLDALLAYSDSILGLEDEEGDGIDELARVLSSLRRRAKIVMPDQTEKHLEQYAFHARVAQNRFNYVTATNTMLAAQALGAWIDYIMTEPRSWRW